MSDRAIWNAEQRRKQLKAEVQTLRVSLENRERELKEIDIFLQAYAKFSSEPTPHIGDSKPHVNPTKEAVGREVHTMLVREGKPIMRDELFLRLAAHGIDIRGKNPKMILSTMLWRMPEKFVRIAGHGYWPRGMPYEPAGYDPDLSKATRSVEANNADPVGSDQDQPIT